MTQVFLMRHANAFDDFGYQEPETPLRGHGPLQAKKLAKRLLTANIDAIYASPYERSHETAKVFAKMAHKKITVEEKLKEIGCAEWTEVDFHKTQEMVEDVLLKIVAENKDKNIAIFTHGNLIRALICKILDASFKAYNENLVISLASITVLHIDDKGLIKVMTVSDDAHQYLT